MKSPVLFHPLGATFCAGMVLLLTANAPAQNLFTSKLNNIIEITPDGTESIFAAGFYTPLDYAFDRAGNLFEGDLFDHCVYKFTPDGTRSTFASGFGSPIGLAFSRAGDLFVSDWQAGNITKITPAGTKSTFASGLSYPQGLAFNNAGDLFVGALGRR